MPPPRLSTISSLARALHLADEPGRATVVAFTGSGGKTACAESLARDAAAAGLRTVLTTTTKMRVPAELMPGEHLADVAAALAGRSTALILGEAASAGRKMLGPPLSFLDALARTDAAELIVVEADGSRGASIKGYRGGEPVLPHETRHAAVVVGVDALEGVGRDSPRVHRPEILWPFLGLTDGARLGPADVARAIFAQPGYLDRLYGCEVSLLINKVDEPPDADRAAALLAACAPLLDASPVQRVVLRGRSQPDGVSVAWTKERPWIGAILLAAGASTRFGAPKLLADVAGVPLVRHALQALRASTVEECVLVLGCRSDEVLRAAAESSRPGGWQGEGRVPQPKGGESEQYARVRVVVNQTYRRGMASSIRTGLEALPPCCEGVLIALADMPRVGMETVDRVLAAARAHPDAIVAPVWGGRRGHPVYFGRRFFKALRALDGDVGGAAIVRAHSHSLVEVAADDAGVLHDVDVPADLAAPR